MLSEQAKVVAIEADGLWVETHQQSACNQCRAKNGCGQKLLAGGPSSATLVKAVYDASAPREIWAVGDHVLIGIEEHALVNGALMAYVLPLLLMVAAVLVGAFFKFSDPLLALVAILGMFLGGFLVSVHGKRQLQNIKNGGTSCYQAVVLARVSAVAEPPLS